MPEVLGPVSAIPMDPNGEFEIIVERSSTDGNILPVTDDFLGAKKRCEARGRELLTIENKEKMDKMTNIFGAFEDT